MIRWLALSISFVTAVLNLTASQPARVTTQPLRPMQLGQFGMDVGQPAVLLSHTVFATRSMNRVLDIEIEIERLEDAEDGSQLFRAQLRRLALRDREFGWQELEFRALKPLWHWGRDPEPDWSKLGDVTVDTDQEPGPEAPNKQRLAYYGPRKANQARAPADSQARPSLAAASLKRL